MGAYNCPEDFGGSVVYGTCFAKNRTPGYFKNQFIN